MLRLFLSSLLLMPALSHAGYYYNGICHKAIENAVSSYVIENHGQSSIYWDSIQSKYVTAIKWIDPTLATTNINTTVYTPYPRNCTNNGGGNYFCVLSSISYYNDWSDITQKNTTASIVLLPMRYRLKTQGVTTPTWSEYVFTPLHLTDCDANSSQLGLEPVNITMNPPPGYDSFLNPSIDWATTEWIFGSGLVLFALGAGIGSIINITKKARI